MVPFVLSQTPSQPSGQLDEQLKRQIHDQLLKLQGLLSETLPQYAAQVAELKANIEAEQQNRLKDAEINSQNLSACAKERDTYKSQADFYQKALNAKKSGKSFGCILKKIFTFGISGCR